MYELIPRIQCCYAPCVLPYISLLHKRPIWCMYTLKLYLFSWVIILSVCSIYFIYVLAMFKKLCSKETVTFYFRIPFSSWDFLNKYILQLFMKNLFSWTKVNLTVLPKMSFLFKNNNLTRRLSYYSLLKYNIKYFINSWLLILSYFGIKMCEYKFKVIDT